MRAVMALVAAAISVAGCAEFRENASAGIVDAVTGTALGPKSNKPADFVTSSRPAPEPFMPVGVSAPDRPVKPKTKAELAAAEAQLAAEAKAQAAAGEATSAEGKRVTSSQPKPPKVE